MREIRPSGSEGGGSELNRSSLPLSAPYAAYSRLAANCFTCRTGRGPALWMQSGRCQVT